MSQAWSGRASKPLSSLWATHMDKLALSGMPWLGLLEEELATLGLWREFLVPRVMNAPPASSLPLDARTPSAGDYRHRNLNANVTDHSGI